jgi:hypothetical protein
MAMSLNSSISWVEDAERMCFFRQLGVAFAIACATWRRHVSALFLGALI